MCVCVCFVEIKLLSHINLAFEEGLEIHCVKNCPVISVISTMQFSGAQPSVPPWFFPQHLRVPRVHPTLLEPTFPGPLWVSQHSQGAAAPGCFGMRKPSKKCFTWKSAPWQFFGDSLLGWWVKPWPFQGLIKWPPMIGDQEVTAWITWPWKFWRFLFGKHQKHLYLRDVFQKIASTTVGGRSLPSFLSQNTQVVYSSQPKSHVQGTLGCTPNCVPMVFVFSRDSWGLYNPKKPTT